MKSQDSPAYHALFCLLSLNGEKQNLNMLIPVVCNTMVLNLSVKIFASHVVKMSPKGRTLLHFCLTKSSWYPFFCNKIIFLDIERGNKADFAHSI